MTTVFLSSLYAAGTQFLNNGNVNGGGFIHTYIAGGLIPANTYTDNTGTTLNANPIQLTPSGRLPNGLWLASGQDYHLVVTDINGVTLEDRDNVPSIPSAEFYSESSVASANQVYSISTAANAVYPLLMSSVSSTGLETPIFNTNINANPSTGTVTAEILQSTVGTGTPPFTVNSTTEVTNLTAQTAIGANTVLTQTTTANTSLPILFGSLASGLAQVFTAPSSLNFNPTTNVLTANVSAANNGIISSIYSNPGYVLFGNGNLIIQFGRTHSGGSSVVHLPTTFPTACLGVYTQPTWGQGGSIDVSFTANVASNTFNVSTWDNNGTPQDYSFSYLAIGY